MLTRNPSHDDKLDRKTPHARSKRQRTDRPDKMQSLAQSLPVSLLLYIMRFLDDFRSLARIQSVCRTWRTFTHYQLNLCWRPRLGSQVCHGQLHHDCRTRNAMENSISPAHE